MNGRDGVPPTTEPRWARISRTFALPFLWLSVAGLVASLAAHLLGWFGIVLPPPVFWGLHTGIFIVALPTVLVFRRMAIGHPQPDSWKAALRGCPPWMRKLVIGFGIYAVANFVLFAILQKTGLGKSGAGMLRGFSGHWMMFYSAAMATLYSYRHVAAADERRRCLNGHRIASVTAKFCEQCGAPLQVGDGFAAPSATSGGETNQGTSTPR